MSIRKYFENIFVVCLGIFLVNFLLKVLYIDSTDIGLDEPFSIYHAQKDIAGVIELLRHENNPPFYMIILHYWIKIFGIGAMSVRMPSVIFSSLAAVVIFLIGKKYFTRFGGLLSSIIFTASSVHMFYAHDARAYALFYFLFSCNTLLFLKLINTKEKNIVTFTAFTLINILMCYTHFFGFVILGVEAGLCLIIPSLRILLGRFIFSSIIVVACFAWYIPTVYDRYIHSVGMTWISEPVPDDIYTMIRRFCNKPIITVVFLLVFAYSIVFCWKNLRQITNQNFRNVLLLFTLSYFGLYILSFNIPLFIDRYLLFTSLYFYLLIGASLVAIHNKLKIHWLVIFIPAIAMLFTLDIKRGKEISESEIPQFIKEKYKMPKSIIICPEWNRYSFLYHYNIDIFKVTDNQDEVLRANSIYTANNIEQLGNLDNTLPVVLIKNGSQCQFENYFKTTHQLVESKRMQRNAELEFYSPR